MLQPRCCEMCLSSDNLIQWRKSLFDTVLAFSNKNKPMLRYKFGSVYLFTTFCLYIRYSFSFLFTFGRARFYIYFFFLMWMRVRIRVQ